MLKYVLFPAPAVLGIFTRLLILYLGESRVEGGELHPRPLYHFADFCLLMGFIFSAVWLCTCLVQDFFNWIDGRPLRKLLREESRRR